MVEEEKGDWGSGKAFEEEEGLDLRIKEEKALRGVAVVVVLMVDWRRYLRERDRSELAFHIFIFNVSGFLGFCGNVKP
jgi:hypothetical protein